MRNPYARWSSVFAVVLAAAWSVSPALARQVAVAAPVAPHATNASDSFLQTYAQTRGFRLGQPTAISVTPSGGHVLFLRSRTATSFTHDLWMQDVATGVEKMIVSAEHLEMRAGSEEKLTVEEKARRERQRVSSRGIVSYELSDDGSKILIPFAGKAFVAEFDSMLGDYPVVHVCRTPRDSEGNLLSIIDPRLSPDGTRIAFLYEGTVWTVTSDGQGGAVRLSPTGSDVVSYGEAEFVAQEEMARSEGYWWSPDSTQVIYQRTDNSPLETFFIADPSDPAKEPQSWRYPRAGKNNAEVTLWLSPTIEEASKFGQAQMNSGSSIELPKAREITWDRGVYPYLARVKWPKAGLPTVLVQNRAQTDQVLLAIDTQTGSTRPLLREQDDAWINLTEGIDLPVWTKDGSRFVWFTENAQNDRWEMVVHTPASGSGQDAVGIKTASSASGVHLGSVLGVFEQSGEPVAVVSASMAADPASLRVMEWDSVGPRLDASASLNGERQHQTLAMNDDATVFVRGRNTAAGEIGWEIWKSMGGLHDAKKVGELSSIAAQPPFLPVPEFAMLDIGLPKGQEIAAVIVRPRDFDKAKKYPVLNFAYGGPGSNEVNAPARGLLLEQWYADHGFIVVSLDARGTPRRGRAWERVTRNNVIDVPLEDQAKAIQALAAKYPEMDGSRVGVFGWSFGGYFSAMAAMRRPDVFKAGVAGAPVCDWRDYDTHYTERFMGMPTESLGGNKAGYDASNVLTYCKDLSVPLLIIHGTADDNVYFTHSLKMTDELFRQGKTFEFVTLAGQTHMVTRPDLVEALHTRIAGFFARALVGAGK